MYTSSDIKSNGYNYTAYYCEENIWRLCEKLIQSGGNLKAIFISNDRKAAPLWNQRLSDPLRNEGAVLWEYHVIALDGDSRIIYDFDSSIGFKVNFDKYVEMTFHPEWELDPIFQQKFRVIPAEVYLKTFASDRSHMINENGVWRRPPPPQSLISTPESKNNIQQFISMDSEVGWGKVMTLHEFISSV
ncbi:protein N-terminal glutamine amidohydrolase [Lepeophtheirus salmonis]|uniref:protein N-terminal glutamine amidohydrolase n=1 Tax=Lepeophtheirus salmonis TaxID=72036 RepID=UPI001AE36F0C|nr:protein N-terminal glutamine amidohydrolase-like [Lepeophtheirus salmonis]